MIDTAPVDPGFVALSYRQIDEIRERFEQVLPLREEVLPYIDALDDDGNWVRLRQPRHVKVEPENFDGPRGLRTSTHLASRASKKYVVFRKVLPGDHVEIVNGQPCVVRPTAEEIHTLTAIEIVRMSQHGLPHEAPQFAPHWREQGLEHLIRWELGLPTRMPEAWKEPAVVLIPASVPELIPEDAGAHPYSTLAVVQTALAGPVAALWHPSFDPLTADWKSKDRSVWMGDDRDHFLGQSLGNVQMAWWHTYDRHATTSDGSPCGPRTVGVVEPGQTKITAVRLIGKESRKLGLGRDVITQPEYLDLGGDDESVLVLEGVERLVRFVDVRDRLVEDTGLSKSWFEHLREGNAVRSHDSTMRALKPAAAEAARRMLRQHSPFVAPPRDDLDAIRALLDLPQPERRCRACGRVLGGRATIWCSEICRGRTRRHAAASQTTLPL